MFGVIYTRCLSRKSPCDIDVTWQLRRVGWNVHVWTMATSLYLSVGAVDAVEWACALCGCHSKWLSRVEQRIWIKSFVKLEHSSIETIQMIQKATAMGNWWLAASSQQCTCLCITSHSDFFGETSTYSGDPAPL